MKKMSIIALLLIAVVVTSSSVSGTYAKYTSTFNATDSARVAKWAFDFNGDAMTVDPLTNDFNFNLFDTVNDITTGANDANVVDGSGETIIAPGTTGSFAIELENNSEVMAQYEIDFEATNTNNIPVEFKVGNGEWKTTLDDIDATEFTKMNGNGSEDAINVEWRWTYTGTDRDATDTNLGIAAVAGNVELSVSAEITVTQID